MSRYVPWQCEQFVSRSASASQCVRLSESKCVDKYVSRSVSTSVSCRCESGHVNVGHRDLWRHTL